ncbi:MAG: BrnA antitoxin family protein [Thermodesulfobacteriota bacterium]
MNKKSSLKTSDEIPKVTKADIARAKFRIDLEEVPRKKRINIMLDSGVLEFFKQKASGRGYQTLINEALKRAINQEDMERIIRRVVREELSQKNR